MLTHTSILVSISKIVLQSGQYYPIWADYCRPHDSRERLFCRCGVALVKLRISRIEQLIDERRLFAKMLAGWLTVSSLHCPPANSVITMASLALGWVGEPAFSKLVEPVLRAIGVSSDQVVHVVGFIVAFALLRPCISSSASKLPRFSPFVDQSPFSWPAQRF